MIANLQGDKGDYEKRRSWARQSSGAAGSRRLATPATDCFHLGNLACDLNYTSLVFLSQSFLATFFDITFRGLPFSWAKLNHCSKVANLNES